MSPCRLLAIVSDRPRSHWPLLEIIVALPPGGSARADERGVALWKEGHWKILKSVAGPREDAAFEDTALSATSEIVLAHRRQSAVGRARMVNTQPLHRETWAFAHVGTIEDRAPVRSRVSARRARELEGETDSELLFAYLLSAFDVAAGSGDAKDAKDAKDAALVCALQELFSHPPMGAHSFILSDANTLYAYQNGHPLYLLERGAADRSAPSDTAVLIASTPLTDEPWRPLVNDELIRVQRDGALTVRTILGGWTPPTPTGPELPFTD